MSHADAYLGVSQGSVISHEGRRVATRRQAAVMSSYDAARTSTEFQNYWANADRLDADSANSREIRQTLVSRSRYEVGNNGYADGIASTYATDLVSVGPTLRMQTGSEGFNQLVELQWYLWTQAIQFRRKLWCLAHAKHQDGEGIGVIRRNPRVRHTVQLDVVLNETEQCQSPYIAFGTDGKIDGIEFDEFGNPTFYEILREHPGATNSYSLMDTAERVPAKYVLHWFKMRRPGQHRGVPECASTLNTGAAGRRLREAVLAANETAADHAALIHTGFQPDEIDAVAPMATLEIQKRMMTALPMGWDAVQMRAEHPNATYESFMRSIVSEQARPKLMPYNIAACDSSGHNFASGKLDHMPYQHGLDIDRLDCDDLCLDPLFDVWFDVAIQRFGWLGGNPEAIGPGARLHQWDWPRHRVADAVADATANEKRLKSGQVGLHRVYTDAGQDLTDEMTKMATVFGVPVSEIQRRLLDITLPPPPNASIGNGKPDASNATDPPADSTDAIFKRNGRLNGAHYG